MKTTVILQSLVSHSPGPVPVYGADGRTVGHARWDDQLRKHTLRIPYEDWKNGVGASVIRFGTAPETQWLPLFEVESEATGASPDGAPSALGNALPAGVEEGGMTHLDAINAGFVRSVREGGLSKLEEEVEETDPETGKRVRIKRELVPVAGGVTPIQQGKDEKLIPVNAWVNLKETRTPVDPAQEKDADTSFVDELQQKIGDGTSTVIQQPAPAPDAAPVVAAAAVEEKPADKLPGELIPGTSTAPAEQLGQTEVNSVEQLGQGERQANPQDARVQMTSTVQAVEEKPADAQAGANEQAPEAKASKDEAKGNADDGAGEQGGEGDSELKTIAKGSGGFLRLRAVAKKEGVADIDKITKADDLIAAIELHREGKVAPAAADNKASA